MKRKKIIPAILLVVFAAGAVIYFDIIRTIHLSPDRIEGSGTIEVTEIDIASKIAGRITDMTADEGDIIKKDQPLVSLAYDELAPQKQAAIANLTNAEKNFVRTEALYKSGSLPKQAYDNALTTYTNAKAQYQQIVATIGNAYLNSPIDGVVLRKNAERGELAFPGSPILVIADIKHPWMNVYVPETKIGHIHIGDNAELTTDSFDKKIFKGKVTAISNKAEFTPKTIQTHEERVKLVFAVKILFENNSELLKPGMPADAAIITRKSQ
jgi:HlyD family secretion protein